MFELEGIDHVALAVRDVSRSIAWYSEVLGFEHRVPGMWGGVPAFIGKGTTALALFPVGAAEPIGAHARKHHDATPRVPREPRGFPRGAAGSACARHRVQFQDHEISHSIYFRDPDGHELEITTYEAGLTGRAETTPARHFTVSFTFASFWLVQFAIGFVGARA